MDSPKAAREGRGRRRWLVRASVLAAYSAAVLYFGTSRNGVVTSDSVITSDKALHGLVFGGLGVLTYRASAALAPHRTRRFHVAVGILWASALGALLEGIQATLSYRSAEFLDFVADLVGAILLVTIAAALRAERPLASGTS
jgi:VanZ family protein